MLKFAKEPFKRRFGRRIVVTTEHSEKRPTDYIALRVTTPNGHINENPSEPYMKQTSNRVSNQANKQAIKIHFKWLQLSKREEFLKKSLTCGLSPSLLLRAKS